jgi:PIN domain nuclease of toxin-antitoxin system
MNKIVLDASVILAVINNEPGIDDLVPELLANAVGGAVNLAEVQAKLVSRGWTSAQAWEDAISPVRGVLPFDAKQAKVAGDLIMHTQSFGDRACLALGMSLQAPVYTAEKSWKKLNVGVRIHIIR